MLTIEDRRKKKKKKMEDVLTDTEYLPVGTVFVVPGNSRSPYLRIYNGVISLRDPRETWGWKTPGGALPRFPGVTIVRAKLVIEGEE